MSLPMHLRALVLITALAAVWPAAASAQVFYDEDDSGGKEYAIPHDDARKQGGAQGAGPSSGGSGGDSSGRVGEPVEPFGEGLSPSKKSDAPGAKSDAGGSGAGDGPSGPRSVNPETSSSTGPAADDGAGGGSTLLWTVGFPLATLVLAGAVVLFVRRRRDGADGRRVSPLRQ